MLKKMLLSPDKLPVLSPNCLIAFQIVGDMRTLGIIYFLERGTRRFGELEKLTHINPVTLTTRLKNLTSLGIIERHEQQDDQQSVTYSLTELGCHIKPIMEQIEAFADLLPDTEKDR